MFVIKSSQPTVEKLDVSVESNGCGNGVGRTGVPVGTVVLPACVTVADAEDALDAGAEAEPEAEEAAMESAVPVGSALAIVVAAGAGAGSGLACLLCGVQSASVDQRDWCEARTSKAAGWVR